MSARTYPRDVWVLTPTFAPKQVTVTRRYPSSFTDYGDVTEKGKLYRPDEMHPTKRVALDEGWKRIQAAQDDLDKRAARLTKKRDNLIKAGG